MSYGHSQQVGMRMMNNAFIRFTHVVGYVCLTGAILEVLGYQSADSRMILWPAVFPLIGAIVALVVLDRRPRSIYSFNFLAVGGVSLYFLAWLLMAQPIGSDPTVQLPLSLVRVSLIVVTGSGLAYRVSNIFGLVIGFAVGEAAVDIATLQAGRAIRLDEVAIEVAVGLVLILSTIALTRNRRMLARPQLDRAALDEEVSALRYRIEVRAAALMHDTVLNHLNAVTKAEPGPIRPELRTQIERDLKVLMGEEWLGDPVPSADGSLRSDWRASALLAAVQEAREQSLNVEVTGDLSAVGRLDPERDRAVGLAAKQCLVNVLKHAEVDHAEVVIIGSESEVTVMVIDAGRGFSESHVAADRLGLRQSVRSRIEAVGGDVQLWTTPGRGTSVMMRIPARPLAPAAAGGSDG